MIPVKVRETNENFILPMAGGDQSFAQISDAGSGVDDRDPSRIWKADLETRGVPAKFLKFGIANWDRAAGSVKFDLHVPPLSKIQKIFAANQAWRVSASAAIILRTNSISS